LQCGQSREAGEQDGLIFDDAMMFSGEVLADESAAIEDFADGRASSPNAASALTEINASAIGLVA
jgi:hypothetical protein